MNSAQRQQQILEGQSWYEPPTSLGKITFDDVEDIKFDNVSSKDSPDYCEASVCFAFHVKENRPCTDEELETLMEDNRGFYDRLMEHLF